MNPTRSRPFAGHRHSARRSWYPYALAALFVLAGGAEPARAQTFTYSSPIVVDNLTFDGGVYTDVQGAALPYRVYVPPNYDPTKTYPVVLFLHGVGESGTNNTSQLTGQTSPLNLIDSQYPAFYIAPQCPTSDQWVNVPFSQGSYSIASTPISQSEQATVELLKSLESQYSFDQSRLYVTGLSMGGYGAWDLIERNPGLFAAAAPIAGAGDPSLASSIAGTPIWAFNGDADAVVPPSGSASMIAALRAAGGSPLYTEYKGVDHNGSWALAYSNQIPQLSAIDVPPSTAHYTESLVPWLYSQSLVESVPEPGSLALASAIFTSAAIFRRRTSRRRVRRRVERQLS